MASAKQPDRFRYPLKGKRYTGCFRLNCIVPFLFVATIVAGFLVMMPQSTPLEKEYHLTYSSVTGYFLQDDAATDPDGFDYTATNFGLIDRAYDSDVQPDPFNPGTAKTQWQRFENEVSRLNRLSPETSYRVLFLGRHGEGYHNVAEAFYGTTAWDCYWSLLDGNETSTWSDALLTPTGINQALTANTFWSHLLTTQRIPPPQTYYTSPLLRCLATAYHTFTNLPLPADRPFVPTIKELFREANGAHTCDRRSSKAVIQKAYPHWVFEDGFQEQDILWRADERETARAQDVRTKVVLDDVFIHDASSWISVSTHSGEIASILRVIGHREFRLGTGQVIPVLVKVDRVKGSPPLVEEEPWAPISKCAEPPAALAI